jgi:hypothetical protein
MNLGVIFSALIDEPFSSGKKGNWHMEERIYVMDWTDIGLRVSNKEGVYIRTRGRKELEQNPSILDLPL